jgi:DNA-binding transcriptional LysR family regulator
VDLRHLRSFATVAVERNFTRAADRLGIAQPPLSRQIRELEGELGVLLFDRSSRPIRLTEPGRLLYEQAVQILASVDQLTKSMKQLGSSQKPRFIIGVVGSIMHGALPEMIRRFREKVADTDVELVELTTVEQVAALKSGRIDAGLGRLRIDDPAIRREILYKEPLVAALSSSDPLAIHAGPITLSALMHGILIIYPSAPRPSYADQLLTVLRDHGCNPRRIVEVREVHTALGLVAAQSGFAIVPASMQHIQRRDICYAPITEQPTSPIILSQRQADVSENAGIISEIGRSVFEFPN